MNAFARGDRRERAVNWWNDPPAEVVAVGALVGFTALVLHLALAERVNPED